MNTQISPMTAEHIAPVARIWHDGWHDGHAVVVPETLTKLRVMPSFLERTAALVAQTKVALSETEEVVGFCTVQGDEIYQMYVNSDARGTGTAAALLADGEARIAAIGHTLAWLNCAIGNARAAAFYEKCGWVNTGEEEALLDTSEGKFPLVLWRFEKRLDR